MCIYKLQVLLNYYVHLKIYTKPEIKEGRDKSEINTIFVYLLMVPKKSPSCTPLNCPHPTLETPGPNLLQRETTNPGNYTSHETMSWQPLFLRPKSGGTFLSYDISRLAGQLFPDNLALAKCPS